MKPVYVTKLIFIVVNFGTAPSVGRSVSKRDSSSCDGTQSIPPSPTEDNFVDYCNMYKQDLAGKRSLLSLSSTVNCRTLYTYYKTEEYDELWEYAGQSLPRGKAVLWSGTHAEATAASVGGTSYVVIGDTLIGYIADKLGIQGDKLWQTISEKFASSLSGVVPAFLGGSCADVYNKNSIFARNEVPYLNESSVSKLIVFIVKSDRTGDYSCNNPNLVELENYLTGSKKGIQYSCKDDHEKVNGLIQGSLFLADFEDEPVAAPSSSKAPVVIQTSFLTVATALISNLNTVFNKL